MNSLMIYGWPANKSSHVKSIMYIFALVIVFYDMSLVSSIMKTRELLRESKQNFI